MTSLTVPRIYVACLDAYNNSILHGVWIDVLEGREHIQTAIHTMLAESPMEDAEEWAIHDYEGFGELELEEWEDLDTVIAYAEFMNEHGQALGCEVLAHVGGDVDAATTMMEERYYGEHASEADFVRGFAEDIYVIPKYLENYIDYEAMARDWFLCDFLSIEIGRSVHVFSEH